MVRKVSIGAGGVHVSTAGYHVCVDQPKRVREGAVRITNPLDVCTKPPEVLTISGLHLVVIRRQNFSRKGDLISNATKNRKEAGCRSSTRCIRCSNASPPARSPTSNS
ncbi:hypothetical protein ADILRU_2247 [Leifsonia rubra CMS 76R]|nr:hypothetical protein ADILRU_2247 [Leifsonia rubra CMS 76R]